MNLLKHVERTILQRGLFQAGERIVVAVSGGLDSTVLLHLLHGLAEEHGWKLAVAHLNHQLRGRSSDADERFVRRLAERLNLPCFVEQAAVRALANRQKLSLEMAARRLRHAFLARSAHRFKAQTVSLAHHADDQVELFFLRLLRGSGGEGLSGMKWCSPSPAAPRIRLVRPLLDVSRQTVELFAKERKLVYREDASNASPDFVRNRIRHQLLPLLRRNFHPAITQTATRLMEIVGAEAAFTNHTAQAWLRGEHAVRLSGFESLPVGVQRAAIRLQLIERDILPDFDLVTQLTQVANRRIAVNARVVMWRDADGRLHQARQTAARFQPRSHVITCEGRAGECEFAGCRFTWQITRRRGAALPVRTQDCEWFDADSVGPVVTLRHWRPGDRFQPIGLPQPAKLQNLLTNARIPREQRRSLVVAETADGRLFWVEQLRIGEGFKLTARTIRRLQWSWQRL